MKILEALRINNEAFLKGQKPTATFSEPLAVLTCIDPRITPYLNTAMGLSSAEVIWVRNAGNVVLDPWSDPLRSLALAIYLKGAVEIVVLGHTDCRLAQLEANTLLDAFAQQGVSRLSLGTVDLRKWSGTFHDPKRNVCNSIDQMQACPFLPPNIPVHGLILDTASGAVEILIDGYKARKKPVISAPLSSSRGYPPAVSPINRPCEVAATPPSVLSESQADRKKDGSPAKKDVPVPPLTPPTVPPPPGPPILSKPTEKNLIEAACTLQDFYSAIRKEAANTKEWTELKKQLSQSKDPLQAIYHLEQAANRWSKTHPNVIQACRLLRSQATQAPTKSTLEALLRRLLNQ